jgi:hypothetical protein
VDVAGLELGGGADVDEADVVPSARRERGSTADTVVSTGVVLLVQLGE